MKRYVFITNEVGNIGGGQLYLRRKGAWLKERGWSVSIFYFLDTPLQIEELGTYDSHYVKEMQIPFASHSSERREYVATGMVSAILAEGIPEYVVIESYSARVSLWGEMLALLLRNKGIAAVNLHYHLTETLHLDSDAERDLAYYKRSRNQLRFINAKIPLASLPDCSKEESEKLLLFAGYSQGDNVAEVECAALEDPEFGNFTILSISRLDKPYLPEAMHEIALFVKSHPEEEFDVISIGDAPSRKLWKRVFGELWESENVRLINLGSLHPIPREAMRRADVALESSASVLVTGMEGVPTIVVDSDDYQGVGIWLEETLSRLKRTAEEPPRRISELLEREWQRKRLLNVANSGCEGGEFAKRRISFPADFNIGVEGDFASHETWLEEAQNMTRDGAAVWQNIKDVKPSGKKEKILRVLLRLKAEKLVYLLKFIKRGVLG